MMSSHASTVHASRVARYTRGVARNIFLTTHRARRMLQDMTVIAFHESSLSARCRAAQASIAPLAEGYERLARDLRYAAACGATSEHVAVFTAQLSILDELLKAIAPYLPHAADPGGTP